MLCLGLCVLQHALQVTASRSSSPLSVILSFGETKNTKSAHRKVQKTANVQVGKLKGGDAKSRTSWTSTTSVPVVVDLNNTRHRNISFLLNILNKNNDTKNSESYMNMNNINKNNTNNSNNNNIINNNINNIENNNNINKSSSSKINKNKNNIKNDNDKRNVSKINPNTSTWKNITNSESKLVCNDINGRICSELASYIVGIGYIPVIILFYICCRYLPIVIGKCQALIKNRCAEN